MKAAVDIIKCVNCGTVLRQIDCGGFKAHIAFDCNGCSAICSGHVPNDKPYSWYICLKCSGALNNANK